MRITKPVTRGFLLGAVVVAGFIAFGVYSLVHHGPLHVVRITKADPQMQSAIKQAHDGLAGFIKELQKPKPEEAFAIKGEFQTPEGAEYLWVRSPKLGGDVFSGKLDQQPMALAGKMKGDPVSVHKKNVVDWLIKDDTGIRGMFTEKVLQNRSGG